MEEDSLFQRMRRVFQVEEEMDEGTQKEAASLIQNIFRYLDKDARDIMTHRKNIVAIDGEDTLEEAFQFMLGESFSRFPIFHEDIDEIIGHLDDYIKDDIDEGIFRFNEYFSGESVKDLLLDVINSGDEALEELVALAKCYRLMSGADADDYARAAYWAHKAAVLARKGWNDNSLEDGLDLMTLAYGELGNVFFSYPGYKDDRFPDVEAAAKYYRMAAECDVIVFNYDFNISAGRAYAALGRYEEMKEMFSSKWGRDEGDVQLEVGNLGDRRGMVRPDALCRR